MAKLKLVDRGRNRKQIAHATLVNTCVSCGETHEMSTIFTVKKWNAWLEKRKLGVHVQAFWPELSPAEREEFFISGVCDACWRKLFPPEDEEVQP